MDKASVILFNVSERAIGTNTVLIGNVAAITCHGRAFLVKRSTGNTIYVAFGSVEPGPKNYHVILTDSFPIFDDAVVIGDVRAVCSDANGLLSCYVRGGQTQ